MIFTALLPWALCFISSWIAVHCGIFRSLRNEINANAFILATAIVFDVIILSAFLYIKASTDIFIIYASVTGILIIFSGERLFLWVKGEP